MEKLNAKHILVTHEYEAQDLIKKIEEGVGFEELAKKFSKCPSSQQGGDLGSFTKGQMVPEFEQAVLSLKPGQVSDPVRTAFGHHLILRY